MARVYLGLGSNVNPEANLRLGVAELRLRFGELQLSGVYQNAAVGFDGADFLNLVVAMSCAATPADIHDQIDAIHQLVGRIRGGQKYSDRPLDIDLLLYDDVILDEPPIRIPRSDVLKYDFVLRPLAEIAPNLVHPETGRTLASHWRDYDVTLHALMPVSLRLQGPA